MKLTLATFNAENLFARFKFRGKSLGKKKYRAWTEQELSRIAKDGWETDKTFFEINRPEARSITAATILATKADVVALQEIECMDTLRRFNTAYLKSSYPYQLVIDSRDPRFIDVAVLSKLPFGPIRTHQFARKGSRRIFSRDCLEVEIEIGGGRTLPLFVNHLKSMLGGREQTAPRRLEQAEEIVRILKARFGGALGSASFAVLGDLNDYLDPPSPSKALKLLLDQGQLRNINEALPAQERWTHYFSGGNEYRQLDYILLSRGLMNQNPHVAPVIERRGMPLRASRYGGPRFPGVGENEPKASDHCPVSVTLSV